MKFATLLFTKNCLSLLVALITIAGCNNIAVRYDIDDQSKKHPATKVFLAYMKSVGKSESFEDLYGYFNQVDQKRIDKAMGWGLFAYSSSYQALKDGHCESIQVKRINSARAQVDCLGPYNYNSALIDPTQERMHLRVFLTQQDDQWFISTSGFQHTQFNGSTHYLNSKGLRFSSALK